MRHVTLLELIFSGQSFGILAEVFQHIAVLADRKTEHRSLAEPLERFHPVARQHNIIRVTESKQRIEAARDDDIQIKEKCRARQAEQVGVPQCHLAELARRIGRHRATEIGEVETLHFRTDAVTVIGETHHVERWRNVARHHAVNPVDVFGAIAGSPLDTENLLGIHHQMFLSPPVTSRDPLHIHN
jgi:hypothetical protein